MHFGKNMEMGTVGNTKDKNAFSAVILNILVPEISFNISFVLLDTQGLKLNFFIVFRISNREYIK